VALHSPKKALSLWKQKENVLGRKKMNGRSGGQKNLMRDAEQERRNKRMMVEIYKRNKKNIKDAKCD